MRTRARRLRTRAPGEDGKAAAPAADGHRLRTGADLEEGGRGRQQGTGATEAGDAGEHGATEGERADPDRARGWRGGLGHAQSRPKGSARGRGTGAGGEALRTEPPRNPTGRGAVVRGRHLWAWPSSTRVPVDLLAPVAMAPGWRPVRVLPGGGNRGGTGVPPGRRSSLYGHLVRSP